MYSDENKYVTHQTCEYCDEQLMLFEKMIFPQKCLNNSHENNPDFEEIKAQTGDQKLSNVFKKAT